MLGSLVLAVFMNEADNYLSHFLSLLAVVSPRYEGINTGIHKMGIMFLCVQLFLLDNLSNNNCRSNTHGLMVTNHLPEVSQNSNNPPGIFQRDTSSGSHNGTFRLFIKII